MSPLVGICSAHIGGGPCGGPPESLGLPRACFVVRGQARWPASPSLTWRRWLAGQGMTVALVRSQMPSQPLWCRETLGRLLNPAKPQFPVLEMSMAAPWQGCDSIHYLPPDSGSGLGHPTSSFPSSPTLISVLSCQCPPPQPESSPRKGLGQCLEQHSRWP